MKRNFLRIQKKICILFITAICLSFNLITILGSYESKAIYAPDDEVLVDGEKAKDKNGVYVQSHYGLYLNSHDSIKNTANYNVGSYYSLWGNTFMYSDVLYINDVYIGEFKSNNGATSGETLQRTEVFKANLKSGKNIFRTENVEGVGGNSQMLIHIREFASAPTIEGEDSTWNTDDVSRGIRTWESLYTDGATGSAEGNKAQTSKGFMYFDKDEAPKGVGSYGHPNIPVSDNSRIDKITDQYGNIVTINALNNVGVYTVYTSTKDAGGLTATGTRRITVVDNRYTIRYDGNGARSGSTPSSTCHWGQNCQLTQNGYKKYYNVSYDSNGGNVSIPSAVANATFLGWQDHTPVNDLPGFNNHLVFNAPYFANKNPELLHAFGYNKSALYFEFIFEVVLTDYPRYKQSSPYFQFDYYMENGGDDLKQAFGDDKLSYLEHFAKNGFEEGRKGTYDLDLYTKDYYPDKAWVANLIEKGVAPLTAKWQNGTVKLPTPTRQGYTFIGWYDGTSNKGKGGATYEPPGDKTLIAKWDKNPTIKATDKTFYEGEYTKSEWLNTIRMQDVSATDQEDGNITSKIKVIYDNVNVDVNGVYKVTYQVSDSVGATVTKDIKVTVKYNNPPTITGEDRWFYESEDVTNTRLLERVKANDIEDGNISNKAVIKSSNVQNHVIGTYKVTYKITDAFGKNAETTVTIYIVKDVPTGDETSSYLRFINKNYINTLKPTSFWRTPGYTELLNDSFNKTPEQAQEHWRLTPEDIKKIKDFNNSHDWSQQSNQEFLEEFGHLK